MSHWGEKPRIRGGIQVRRRNIKKKPRTVGNVGHFLPGRQLGKEEGGGHSGLIFTQFFGYSIGN